MIKVGAMVCSYYLLSDLSLPNEPVEPSLEEAIELTADAGMSAIELQDDRSGIFDYLFPRVPPKSRLAHFKEVADSHGVRIPVISVMSGSLLEPNSSAQISYVRKWLDLASSIGVGVVKMNVGPKPQGLTNGAAFERAQGCFKQLVKYAEDYDIPLAPELWPPSYPTSDPVAMLTMLKNIDSPYFRHTIDNFWLPHDWTFTALRLLAPYTVNAHVSIPRKTDLNEGTDRFKFNQFVRILKANGYDGYLMIEWRSADRPLPKLVRRMAKTRAMLERIIASSA